MSPAFCLSAIINASPSLVIIPFIMESDIEDEFWFSLFSEIQPALSIFSIWCLLPTTCLLFCCLSEIWLQVGGQHSDYSGAARSNTMLQSWTADRQYIDLPLLPPPSYSHSDLSGSYISLTKTLQREIHSTFMMSIKKLSRPSTLKLWGVSRLILSIFVVPVTCLVSTFPQHSG